LLQYFSDCLEGLEIAKFVEVVEIVELFETVEHVELVENRFKNYNETFLKRLEKFKH
jgi:hypothetical protein